MSSSLWLQCLDSLKNEIPATEFSMWVRPLQADHDNNTLTLYAPNRFVLDWVQEKYLNDINRLVNEYSETKLVLRFEVGSLENKPLIKPVRAQPSMVIALSLWWWSSFCRLSWLSLLTACLLSPLVVRRPLIL